MPIKFISQSVHYFDNNATTPILHDLIPVVTQGLMDWGNPSSIHWAGRAQKTVLRETKQILARSFSCHPFELIFTSGASESNNTIIRSAWQYFSKQGKNHFLYSAVEHPSVRKTYEYLKTLGAEVEEIPVLRSGCIDLEVYKKLLRPDKTALVSCMYVNNETGNVFPIKLMSTIAHEHGALFHTDAVQALGKLPISLEDLNVDYACFSAHKFYALKGTGILYVRRNSPLEPLIFGGGQERGRRGGTENTLGIRAFGYVMSNLSGQVQEYAKHMLNVRDYFESKMKAEIADISITGESSDRVANTSSLVINGVDGETLLMSLDLKGIAVSTGAACSSGSPEPSPVLLAMGLTRQEAQNSLRVSFNWSHSCEDVEHLVSVLKIVVQHIRSISQKSAEKNIIL